MIWLRVVGVVLALNLGFLAGWIVRWRLALAQAAWPTRCGVCGREQLEGPRRQLFVEIWDSYGMQYKQWAVGKGELLHSRPPGPWLWDAITVELARLDALTHAALVKTVAPGNGGEAES